MRGYRMVKAERASAERTGLAVLTRGRAAVEGAFERALATTYMVFQPLVSAQTQTCYGYEALVRCREPSMPHPGVFLNAAERLGRLHDLGRIIRAASARTFADAPAELQIFVNLHPDDLRDPDLYAAGAPLSAMASRVVLELTERAGLEDIKDLDARIEALRAMGYRIALDDLGAGYAALASLARLRPEVVKIDMSLVRGIDTDPVRLRLVGLLVAACKALDAQVVAEGIETAEERDVVVAAGCDLLQGYLHGRPLETLAAPRW
jgi:EAL domain-containing protein (putative c-di-GMP-specific phosphodiesterase class I)